MNEKVKRRFVNSNSRSITYNLLGGERTFANTSGIGLDNAKHSANLMGTHTETSANTTDGSRRRSNIRICSEINIEHGSVGTFDKDLLAFLDSRVDLVDRITNHGKKIGKH